MQLYYNNLRSLVEAHVDDAPNAVTGLRKRAISTSHLYHLSTRDAGNTHMHVIEALVDAFKGLVMSDKLVNPKLAREIVFHDTRKLGSALDTTES